MPIPGAGRRATPTGTRHNRSSAISFALTKLASLLVYPLTQSLLLSLLALLCFRWRRLAAGLVMLSVSWLYLASTGLFADFLMGSLEDHYPPKAMAAVPARAIMSRRSWRSACKARTRP